MSDNYDHQNHDDQHSAEENTMDDNNQQDQNFDGLEFVAQGETPSEWPLGESGKASPRVDMDALQELWLAAAQEAPTLEDLELSKLELEEAEQKLEAQRKDHQLAVLERVRVFGRGEVADALEISRKALATWEAELQPEGDDLSGFYEELKKNREREARRAQRAAEKAAQQAASMERLLERIRSR